eukprot:m.898933 g.898933  ORF g.898933 m.898933 type:complete len:217 (-) comp23676_c0_seq8:3468-4118(-)
MATNDFMDEFDTDADGAAPYIKRLQEAWVSEKAAPEILQYETDAVSTLLDLTKEQEELSREHATDTVNHQFLYNVYQVEISRIKFLLRSYLRTRLRKIEDHATYILKDDALQSRLSSHELRYANDYRKLIAAHMQNSCLSQIPDKFRALDAQTDKENMVVQPNRNSHVFCLVNDNIGLVQVGVNEGSTVAMEEDDLFIVRYDAIEDFLLSKKVSLL